MLERGNALLERQSAASQIADAQPSGHEAGASQFAAGFKM
jgi:hypothetical protein